MAPGSARLLRERQHVHRDRHRHVQLAPPSIEPVRSDSVPSTIPATIAPSASGSGFWKWIMQYGTTATKMACAPRSRLSVCSRNPRKKNSSDRNCSA